MSNFTAPAGGNSKRIEVPLLNPGQYLVTLYGLCDLGTQDSKYYDPKRQICLSFETSQEQAEFWEGDGMKPFAIQAFKTFSMYKDAGLRKDLVENMIGRKLTDPEADAFDFGSLLGKHYVAGIIHSANGKYMNITSIAPLDSRNMKMFDLTEPKVQIHNPLHFFHVNDGFESENFKGLPKFLRDMLKDSHEGQAFIRSGKAFNEPTDNSSAPAGSPQSPPTAGRKFQMKPGQQYTKEQYNASGWSDQQIVDAGFAEWVNPTPPPAPVGPPAPAPAAPQPPSAPPAAPSAPATPPVAAAPQAPPAAPAPTGDNHPIQMRNAAQQSQIDAFLEKGWTYELLVNNSLADWKPGQEPGNPIHGNDEVPY